MLRRQYRSLGSQIECVVAAPRKKTHRRGHLADIGLEAHRKAAVVCGGLPARLTTNKGTAAEDHNNGGKPVHNDPPDEKLGLFYLRRTGEGMSYASLVYNLVDRHALIPPLVLRLVFVQVA